jgi:hypothetical protein
MKTSHWYDYVSINLFWLVKPPNTALGSIFMPYLVGILHQSRSEPLWGDARSGLVIAMLVQPAAGL